MPTHKNNLFPSPITDEVLDSLYWTKWFPTMNLFKEYRSIQMAEELKEKTAFTTPNGFYQFKILLFRLCNDLGSLQILMQYILQEYTSKFCLISIDDVIDFSSAFEERLNHLQIRLHALRVAKFKVKIWKCKSGLNSVELLGHIVSRMGIHPT